MKVHKEETNAAKAIAIAVSDLHQTHDIKNDISNRDQQ